MLLSSRLFTIHLLTGSLCRRHMLQMPSKEELVQFSANFSAEAREAAAALAKLEADRERQQAELREV